MKFLLIVPGGVDPSGRRRVIPALLALIKRLARRHQVLVASFNPPVPCSYELFGAQVINLGRRGAPLPGIVFLKRWQQLLSGLKSWGSLPEIIHALGLGGTSTLALLLGRRLRAPVVVSLLGGELIHLPQIGYGGRSGPQGRIQAGLALRWAAAVTAGSRYALAPLTARRPEAHWLPLGVEAQLMSGPVMRPTSGPGMLLQVANLNRVKDQATLLRALRVAIDRNNSGMGLYLDCIGEDTLDGSLQQLAENLKITGCVKFHGFKPVDRIYPFYRRAHLYVQSSLHESQGVAVCEAAAAGVPTVGTSVGLVQELAPGAAWAVPVGDHEALATGILTLLGDKRRREQLGRAAQAWAQKYDADWTAGTLAAIYASLLKQG
jgi:glycosyltransferase involved in cell wall biosynthesis